MNSDSGHRFDVLDLSDNIGTDFDDDDNTPGRVPMLGTPAEALEDERARIGIASLAPNAGAVDRTVKVAGVAGWYAGDRFGTTSGGSYSQEGLDLGLTKDSGGIVALEDETACQRARRLLLPAGLNYRLDGGGRFDSKLQTWIPEPGTYYVVRECDGEPDKRVGGKTVGKKFHILQPDTLDILDSIIGEDIVIDRGGTMKGDAVVWLQTRMQTVETPTGPAQTRALVSNSFDGSAAFSIIFCLEVLECRNVYKSILRNADNIIKIRHTAGAMGKLADLRRAFDGSAEMFATAQAEMMSWGRKTITNAVRDKFILSVFAPKGFDGNRVSDLSTRTRNNVDRFIAAYNTAPGAAPGTVWGLTQAATFYASHPGDAMGIPSRGATSAADSVWTGAGATFESDSLEWARQYMDETEETPQLQHVFVTNN